MHVIIAQMTQDAQSQGRPLRSGGDAPRPSSGAAQLAMALLAIVAASLSVVPPVAGAGLVTDRLPDLRMAKPRDMVVCGTPTTGTFQSEDCPPPAPEDRWLRFTSLLMNIGVGPLRLAASRASTEEEHMTAVQRIKRTDGSWRTVPSGATLHWAEEDDGHPHWHIEGMERYRLFQLPEPFPKGASVGVKRGYCIFDGRLVRPDLPFARARLAYPFESCGKLGASQDLLAVRVGQSVGWGDEYAWDYAGQRIPVHQARDGDYLLCLNADPLGQVRELREGNNESWARIRMTTVEDRAGYRVDVSVLDKGMSPCQDQVPYRIARLPTTRTTR